MRKRLALDAKALSSCVPARYLVSLIFSIEGVSKYIRDYDNKFTAFVYLIYMFSGTVCVFY